MANPASASFTTAGVSIRRPILRAPRVSVSEDAYLCFPAEAPTSVCTTEAYDGGAETDRDDEALAVFQELAFQYAMEQTRSAVRTILLSVNKKCYSDAHRFLQRHMRRSLLSRQADLETPSLVPFPSLMKIPAAAIVSGSDATFSDVWMTPLFHAIHRSFPAILLIRDTIADGRQMVEWVMERLDEYRAFLKKEEAWITQQIDARLTQSRRAGEGEAAPFVVQQQRTRRLRERPARASTSRSSTSAAEAIEKESSGDEYQAENGSESSEDSGSEDGGVGDVKKTRGTKRKRQAKGTQRRSAKVRYATLLLRDLMTQLREKMRIVERSTDPTVALMSVLRDLILEDLEAKLKECMGDVMASAKCYDDCIDYMKRLIVGYRQIGSPASHIRAASVEFSLATLMLRVLSEYSSFLASCESSPVAESDLVRAKTYEVEVLRVRHKDAYHLHNFNAAEYDKVTEQLDPFVVICVENLDSFNLQALSEFVDLWGNYGSSSLNASEKSQPMELGFVFGVTTTTSQTLRQLGLSIIRRLDIQFYPLEDSKTRAEDILETLFVQNHFPLCLRGDALRLLDERHLTTQSLTAFMQALEFVALSHFQDEPWSFLSHFALDLHHEKPLHIVGSHSPALRRWLERRQFRGRSVRDYLSCFSEEYARTLCGKAQVPGPIDKLSDSAITKLENELARFRNKRREWIVGWKCFRSAVTWSRLGKKEEDFVQCLVMALDGQIALSRKAEWIFMILDQRPLDVTRHLMEDWAALTATLQDPTVHRELQDLLLISDHVLETNGDAETLRMRPSFRAEITNFFRKRLLGLMDVDEPPANSVRALVNRWSFAGSNPSSATEHVVLRLHEDVIQTLTTMNDEAYIGGTAASDLSLLFLHYREHAGLQLNVSDWYDSFAGAVREEAEASGSSDAADHESDEELNARFVRALTTMRLWGYIKGPDAVRGSGRRFQDMRVQKCIFI